MCRLPASVADLASELDLPLGVVQILLADLRVGRLQDQRQRRIRRVRVVPGNPSQ